MYWSTRTPERRLTLTRTQTRRDLPHGGHRPSRGSSRSASPDASRDDSETSTAAQERKPLIGAGPPDATATHGTKPDLNLAGPPRYTDCWYSVIGSEYSSAIFTTGEGKP
jgi:hypothetical protein